MDKKEILCRSQKENYIFDEFSRYVDKKAYANAYLAILVYSGIAALIYFLSQAKLTAITAPFCSVLPLPFAVVLSRNSAATEKRKTSSLC